MFLIGLCGKSRKQQIDLIQIFVNNHLKVIKLTGAENPLVFQLLARSCVTETATTGNFTSHKWMNNLCKLLQVIVLMFNPVKNM